MATAKKTTQEATEETSEHTPVSEVIETMVPNVDWRKEREYDEKRNAQRVAQMAKDLAEPFAHEVEKVLKKGGASLTYIPISEVINRMNKVFGIDGWSSEIIKCERDAHDPDFIVACVRVTAHTHGDRFVSISKDGYGGQKIKRTKQGDIVDLGDEFKGAVSDALKKAVQQFGIGLYLARSEEALSLDEAEEAAASAPRISDMYPKFKTFLDKFSPEQKGEVKTFWSKYSNGRPTPKPHEFTDSELQALIAECVRIEFSGIAVSEFPSE
jgi:hypothetical protein